MDEKNSLDNTAAAHDTVPENADAPLPSRGILLSHNRKGRAYGITCLKKWMRLNTTLFKVEKVDVAFSKGSVDEWTELLEFAKTEDIRLSLRIQNLQDDTFFNALPELELLDILLAPEKLELAALSRWISRAQEHKIPVRLLLPLTMRSLPGLEESVACFKAAAALSFTWEKHFSGGRKKLRAPSAESIQWMNSLTRRLNREKVDVTLLNIPYCLVDEDNHGNVLCGEELFRDHSQYLYASWTVAKRIFLFGHARASLILDEFLASRQGRRNLADNLLLPWVFGKVRIEGRLWLLRRLSRYMSPDWIAVQREKEHAKRHKLLPVASWEKTVRHEACTGCRFYRLCIGNTALFEKGFTSLNVTPFNGTPLLTAATVPSQRYRWFDVIDQKRRHFHEHQRTLAEEALRISRATPPSKEMTVLDYAIEDHYNHWDGGDLKRWFSLSRGEMISTVLARLTPPFTLMVTFGGGIAEQIGFSFGRHAKIVCPMIDYSHKLTLHVDRDGYYALLRDGMLVRPTEFSGASRVPERLPGILEPRISMHNVDGYVLTTTLLLWDQEAKAKQELSRIRYSVIIVSVRYARRLQAALLSLAHQKNFPLDALEVVLAYVPGADGAEDLIDAMECRFPQLRIVRVPFPKEYVRSKGFMINESLHAASGEWITLLDADIVLPPDIFARVDAVSETSHFIAPDGRYMLSPDTTHAILLGERKPWEEYDAIAAEAIETRHHEAKGYPLGFFQCIRRDILEKVPYQEFNHFEGADWFFSKEVIDRFGDATRLSGVYVLHLDHEGRQWYGTEKHR